MPDFIAYYRVSTDRQGASGLGLDAQRATVEKHIKAGDRLLLEFTEIESGKKHSNRPQLLKALEECRKRKATLIIARLDRLARNVAFISALMENGTDFIACDMPEANRLTIHILAAVAEHEREMISQRTKLALQQAKARGTKLGNPNPLEALKLAKLSITHLKPAPEVLSLITQWNREGKGLREISRELNRLNIRTPRGKLWYASSVKNQLTTSTVSE
jgi:DNA invertase Pin-like site-specific DNA recombinase